MFNIGDKVVYPTHGAGVIESIEEKEILGEKKSYYVMKMPISDITLMVPTNNVDTIGIREVMDLSDADRVFKKFETEPIDAISNWNKRYRENMVKLKSGDIFQVTEVVKSLMVRDKQKGLSTGERKMLNNAKQILVSELVLAKGLKPNEVEDIIDSAINYTQTVL